MQAKHIPVDSVPVNSLDSWSDSEDGSKVLAPSDLVSATRRIAALETKLAAAKEELADYRSLVNQRVDIALIREAIDTPGEPVAGPSRRDDDSHYFDSYGVNGKSIRIPITYHLSVVSLFLRHSRGDDPRQSPNLFLRVFYHDQCRTLPRCDRFGCWMRNRNSISLRRSCWRKTCNRCRCQRHCAQSQENCRSEWFWRCYNVCRPFK